MSREKWSKQKGQGAEFLERISAAVQRLQIVDGRREDFAAQAAQAREKATAVFDTEITEAVARWGGGRLRYDCSS